MRFEELRAQQVVYGMAELLAGHYLLHHVRDSSDAQKVRMVAGATMAGLGFAFGPELESRIRGMGDHDMSEKMRHQLVSAAGGAVIGAVAAYALQPKDQALAQRSSKNIAERLERLLGPVSKEAPAKSSTGLLTVLSAGWLGYSLFLDGKTPQEQHRHLWMLGSGAIGYLYAPELMRKIASIPSTAEANARALDLYKRGGLVLGGLIGGTAGWYMGSSTHRSNSSPSPEKSR